MAGPSVTGVERFASSALTRWAMTALEQSGLEAEKAAACADVLVEGEAPGSDHARLGADAPTLLHLRRWADRLDLPLPLPRV